MKTQNSKMIKIFKICAFFDMFPIQKRNPFRICSFLHVSHSETKPRSVPASELWIATSQHVLRYVLVNIGRDCDRFAAESAFPRSRASNELFRAAPRIELCEESHTNFDINSPRPSQHPKCSSMIYEFLQKIDKHNRVRMFTNSKIWDCGARAEFSSKCCRYIGTNPAECPRKLAESLTYVRRRFGENQKDLLTRTQQKLFINISTNVRRSFDGILTKYQRIFRRCFRLNVADNSTTFLRNFYDNST